MYADAACAVIHAAEVASARAARHLRGAVLAEEGAPTLDLDAYVPGATPQVDLFVDHV